MGTVVRNSQGQPFFSTGRCISMRASVEEAKGLALLTSLRELSRFFNGAILVELDCMALAKALEPGIHNQSSLFSIVNDIQAVLNSLSSFQIGWVSRKQSKLAHSLADLVRTSSDFFLHGRSSFGPRQ